jgi:tetratricopeptide (TPR) repeat protein
MPTRADLLAALPAPSAAVVPLLLVALLLGLAAILVGLWLLFGRGPRRSRAYHRAQRLLHHGAWEQALAIVKELQQGRLSVLWQGRLRSAEGECHHAAGDAALKEKRYEDSLGHYRTAAGLLDLDPAALRDRVLDGLLGEARRLFATGAEKDLAAAQALLARGLLLQTPCPEASFWLGLCHVRQGQLEQAFAALALAHQEAVHRVLDPPLYLGALHLREGRPQEALRYLSEANRIDGTCPLVTWQLGLAMVAAGTDSRIAVQALQRACGPRGLSPWAGQPWDAPVGRPAEGQAGPPAFANVLGGAAGLGRRPGDGPAAARFWVEALPESRSYVRRLAVKYPFSCPVFGNDVAIMLRQGQLALAQAHYRLGNFQESADLYGKLLQESPPTLPLLRGLGLALARLGRYDQAYKHLKTALEQDPKDHRTAGYLALCGALGKPAQDEDKPRNVAWAVRLLGRYDVPPDPEWAGLMNTVFAEARSVGLPLAAEDQVRLCDVLAAVDATDSAAAAAYHHLAATAPDAGRPRHAWLYCRAAQQHGVTGEHGLGLFARTFQDEPAARAFYAERRWDLDEVEYVYLARSAAARPGSFPPELGPGYATRGEDRLLARSWQQESAGHADTAFATAEVLLRLAPGSAAAHDRLAYLHYQRGDLAASAALLAGWHRLRPDDHQPLCKLAVVEHQRGNAEARRRALDRALDVSRPPGRADVAFLGARLSLQAAGGKGHGEANGQAGAAGAALKEARHFLEECLQENPNHEDALWQLAAVRSVTGDREGLAAQAPAMHRPDVRDGRFHYLAAVCHLAAGDYGRALEAAGRSAADPDLAADSHYLMGWAHLYRRERAAAAEALRKAAAAADSASVDNARALLGRVRFTDGATEEAVECWTALTPLRRREWQLEEALRSTVFLTGLQAYQDGRFEQASSRFREAGRLGLRDRRLGPLLFLALFRAGQRLLFGGS